MRIVRVRHNGVTFYGSLLEGAVKCLHRQLGYEAPVPLSEVSVLPLVAPSKVICAADNYRSATRSKAVPDLSFFLKPSTSVLGNGQSVLLPSDIGRVEAGPALAVVIGQVCRNVTPEDAARHILGYTCANDVTAVEIGQIDSTPGRSKSYDTFCPVGPWLETELPDFSNLSLRCVINGELCQEGNTAELATPPLELISGLSKIMTLMPGDLVLTGTPPGTPEIRPGDMVQIEAENVSLLFNRIEELNEQPTVLQ